MASSVVAGASFLAAGRYAVAILGWAGSIILVRVLSPRLWGGYSLIFNIMGLIGALADLKLGRAVLQQLQEAGEQAKEVLGSYVTLRLLIGVVCYGAAMVVVVAGRYPAYIVASMAVAALVLLVAALETAIYIYFSARMWMRSLAGAQALAQAVQLLATVLLWLTGYRQLLLFMIPPILFEVVVLGWQVRVMRGFPRLRLDPSRWSSWFREVVYLSVGATLASIYEEIDSILLSKLSGLSAVGVYAVGQKFANFTQVVSNAISVSLFVTLTRSWPDDPDGFVMAFRRACAVMFVVAVGVAVEFGLFAPQGVSLLYGHRYRVGAEAATLLVVSEAVAFFCELCVVALAVLGRNLSYLLAAGMGVAVNVALNVVLIPDHSYNGAGVAIVATQAAVLAWLVAALRRHGARAAWVPGRAVLKTAAAGLVLAGVAVGMRLFAPWIAAAVVSFAAYLALLHVFKVGGPRGIRDLVS